MSKPLRIVFAGTPDFAAHHLAALLANQLNVVAVYTQPDRPAGRGKKLRASPVKELALTYDIPLYQPETVKTEEAQQTLHSLQADLLIVVAYGLILPKAILDTPRLGCVNVHASLLPRWRGAAPIQRAIEAGDSETGVTIMQMDEGLDTGDMLLISKCKIDDTETASSLHDKLAELGSDALLRTIAMLGEDTAKATPQPESGASYASKISKQEAFIDWSKPAAIIDRQIRAFNPFPIAYSFIGDTRIKIWKAHPIAQNHSAKPGTILSLNPELTIACGKEALTISHAQLPGGKALPISELLKGHAELLKPGQRLDVNNGG